MLKKTLDQTHAEYDGPHWVRLHAIYAGGKLFKRHLREFLPRNPNEPDERYECRLKEACFEGHVGPIVDYFTAWLFSMAFSVKARDAAGKDVPTPDFYTKFHAEVGEHRSLPDFIKDRTTRALAVGAAYTILEKPALPKDGQEPENLAEFNKAGLDRIRLGTLEREQILDWECDDDGNYEWIVVRSGCQARGNPLLPGAKIEIVQQWRIYDRTNVTLFEQRYEKGAQPPSADEDILVSSTEPHGFACVPILRFELPEALHAGDRTYEPQLEHFRLSSALAWSIRQTAYAMPVICSEDSETSPPRMGIGYYLQLGPNDKFTWSAPPTAPFDIIQKSITARREEIYRVNHQMAQALDNNAETVGRSADSKSADTASTRIVLNSLGSEVRKFVEKLYETLSQARGEKDLEWIVEGLGGYDTATAGSLIGNATAAGLLGIPSKKFRQEISTKVAMALLPDADHAVKDQIRKEISEFDFKIHDPMDAQNALRDATAAKAELEQAKAAAEPIKAKAATTTAEKPAPSPNGGPKATAPQRQP